MLWNLTCEHGFHSALLEADVTCTLLELLGSSSVQSTKKNPKQTTSTALAGGGGGGGGGGCGGSGNAGGNRATTASPIGSSPSSGAIHVHDSAGGTGSGEHSGDKPREDTAASESAQDSSTTSGGAGMGGVLDPGGAIGGGATSGSSGGHTEDDSGKDSKRISDVSGVGLASPDAAGTGHTPTLEVRRNVLGAVMNLTSFSISDPRLDPKAVLSLLTLIMREDPNERLANTANYLFRPRRRCRWCWWG